MATKKRTTTQDLIDGLRSACEARGGIYAAFADNEDLRPLAYSILSGRRSPKVDSLIQIAGALGRRVELVEEKS